MGLTIIDVLFSGDITAHFVAHWTSCECDFVNE